MPAPSEEDMMKAWVQKGTLERKSIMAVTLELTKGFHGGHDLLNGWRLSKKSIERLVGSPCMQRLDNLSWAKKPTGKVLTG